MKRTRSHSASRVVELYPLQRSCGGCQQPLRERYHKRRWIVTLSGEWCLISHVLECQTPGCRAPSRSHRPEGEASFALPGYTFGLDVVARIGELRYRQHQTLLAIREQLRQEGVKLSVKEVELLSEVFLALVSTVAGDEASLVAELNKQGGIILAIDGVQPEKGNETLYLLGDTRSGRVLVARNLLSSATQEVAGLIDEVLALKVPLLSVISDKQESICLAIERRLPEVPHQLCHYHYLRHVAQPISDADRSLKKQLKQRVRGLREVEIKVAREASVEGQVVRDYCLTLRTVMREEGKYPLDPAGIALYDKLAAIAASLRRALQQHPSAKLQRLLTLLGVLERCEAEYARLVEAWSWIHQLAHLLAHATSRAEATAEIMSYATGLKAGASENLREIAHHVGKLTLAFAPYLFAYLDQPLLPRTNNELELFIGQLKKSRRQVTGRKNVSAYILREGGAVALLFGLPAGENWLDCFAKVEMSRFRERLAELRRAEDRSKCWQIRRRLEAFLGGLEQLWQAQNEPQLCVCNT